MPSPAAMTLWLGVVAVGAYHGLNPAMGWPLAVANAMSEKRDAAVVRTFVPLGIGHLLAMALVLVPFALLSFLITYSREIRVGAGAAVVLFGAWRLFSRRHPRWLARVRPTQLLLWSVLMATAHGAALMLLPIYMGLCDVSSSPVGASPAEAGHEAMAALMRTSVATAVQVSLLHTAAMMASGLAAAWLVYRHLGLRALRGAWLNLELAWALCLVGSGSVAVVVALTEQ